ncbi:hypothetical protein [Pricia sp.]|uniref:hypothetical protein n=1 Tax=Pricia sp. TaxID=2268138 RepID=UPI0035931953
MNTPKKEYKGTKKMTKEKLIAEKPKTASPPDRGPTHTGKLNAVQPPKRGRTHTGG